MSEPETGKKLTTPYPHKYKTVICRFWAKGQKCPFANECNYAHGKGQLVQEGKYKISEINAGKDETESSKGK
jgi:hypothetical protein